jgi:ribosomal protein S18 acetylase RimI-like enzyme
MRFYVDRPWFGRGVAPALMAACAAEARRRGGDVLWLGVWERNARAIAFYEKCGFRRVGIQPFQLGSDRQTDYVMARPLRADQSSSAGSTALRQ